LILSKGISFGVRQNNMAGLAFGLLLAYFFGMSLAFFLFRRRTSSGQMGFGKSKFSRNIVPEMTGKLFKDVAGIDEAKAELQEVV
jgi:ATP-dependent Zn protease